MNFQPMNAADRRGAERRSALDVYLCLVDLGDNRSAMLIDVSEAGIGVQAVQGPAEGFTTSFRFQLPETAVLIEGEGEISWADRAGRMGIRFTKIAPELIPELRKWVASEANPLFANQPVTEQMADLDARDRVAQLEARIIVSGWAQLQALNFLVDQIAAMTQAGGVAIAVEDGGGIVCKASTGIAPQAGQRVDSRSGLSWECVRTKEVVQCADTENDPRVDRIICRQLNMRSAMLVPVKKEGRVAGLVEVFSSQPHAFTNQTVILLRRVAEAVASLDETAPDLFGDSEPLLPPPAMPVASSSPVGSAPPKSLAETRAPIPMPGPVVVKPAPQAMPAPSVAPVVRPSEPVPPQPVLVQKPVAATIAPVSSPAPAAKPVVAPPAPVKTAFVQEVAAVKLAEAPPVPVPLVMRPVEATPAPVVFRPTENSAVAAAPTFPVVTRSVEVAVPPVVKPIEKPAADKPIAVEKPKPQAAPSVAVREIEPPKPAAATAPASSSPASNRPAEAAMPVVAKAAVAEKLPGVIPTRPPSNAAPLPAVAFSGAAAASAAKRAAVPEPPKKEQPKAEIAVEESPALLEFAQEEAPDRRKLYIGVAAAAFIVLSTYGGWYWAHVNPTPPKSTVTQPANPPAAQPAPTTPLPTPTALTTPASNNPNSTAAAAKPAAPVPEKSSAAKPSPVATPQRVDETPVDRTTTSPITATSFVPPPQREPVPVAPVITLPPPNTAGMASLLATPVETPKLSRSVVSQGVTGGKLLLQVQPQYPANARAMRLNGTVTMVARISKTGTVSKVDVISGHPMLNAAAVDAVRRWKYEPFKLNGEAIENDINVNVKFGMPR